MNAKTEDFMNAEVCVFCPECKDGKNAIWFGSLIDWMLELSRNVDNKPPAWFIYCKNHQRAHGHKIMVKYPDKTVPLDLQKGNERKTAEQFEEKLAQSGNDTVVRCPKCGRTQYLRFENGLKNGWSKCCDGLTMPIIYTSHFKSGKDVKA